MTNAALHRRLFSWRAGVQLARNTVVSTFIFAIDLLLLWLLVEQADMDKVLAAAVAFIIANSLHYLFGRWWIFQGTERKSVSGYIYFLANAGVGLVITLMLFAAFVAVLPAYYLVGRVLVSVVSGLTVFVLNAVLNFRTV
ncbi:MAG: GtrA family protein [Pseudomonadota bacterium]